MNEQVECNVSQEPIFRDESLRQQALTHKSFHNENISSSLGDNERLEFLGDAVLDLILSEELMERFPQLQEGPLSKMRASLVNESFLADLAVSIGLDGRIRLGKGEKNSQGAQKPRILAACLEAMIGALFLDSGYSAAKGWVLQILEKKLNELKTSDLFEEDAKTRLQELVQERLKTVPAYEVISTDGPSHDRTFEVQLLIGGSIVATGKGRSKKLAEQQAAAAALVKFR